MQGEGNIDSMLQLPSRLGHNEHEHRASSTSIEHEHRASSIKQNSLLSGKYTFNIYIYIKQKETHYAAEAVRLG